MLHDDILNFDCKGFAGYLKDRGNTEPACNAYRGVAIILYLLREIKKDVAVFYFDHDEFEDDESLMETGFDFMRNGILAPPYDNCLYILKNFVAHPDGSLATAGVLFYKVTPEIDRLLKNLSPQFSCAYSLIQVTGEKWVVFEFNEAIIGSGIFYPNPYVGFLHPQDPDDKRKCSIIPLGLEAGMEKLKINPLAGAWSSSTMLLNTKYTFKKETKISDKLQRARIKSGKLPLNDYNVISIFKDEHHRRLLTGCGTSAFRKPHWRRGHVRNLTSGKITFVRPTLVGFDGGDVDYKVYDAMKATTG